MTTADPSPSRRVGLEEFLAADPHAFGDRYEIVDGLVVQAMAQSPAHDRVVRRLADALERAIDPDGPCREVNSDTAVRLADGGSAEPSGRLNVRFPDVLVRDCSEPYDAATVASGVLLVAEVTSEGTIDADTTVKRRLYARAGIPIYLIVYFDKDWETISEVEELRLDWSGVRYAPYQVHRDALVLTQPVSLAVTFADLQRRLPRR